MKNIFNQVNTGKITFVLLMLTSILVSNCGIKEPEPSQQEIVTEQLTSATWNLQTVTVDDVDQTSVYQGLTLKFTETTYTTTKGELVWPASGTWSFTDDTATTIKRDDGAEIKAEATDTSLKLTLTWGKTTLGTGRVGSVKGLHVFTFRK